MRNAVQEYLSYSDEEKKDLWDHATFVFDTNVLLNLYRYSDKARKSILAALNTLQERLWMPNHVAREFMKNRKNAIWASIQQYEDLKADAEKFISSCASTVKLDENESDLAGLKAKITEWIEAAKKKNILVSEYNTDPVLDQLLTIYEGKVGLPFSIEEQRAIETEGKTRYESKVPPGYKDLGKQNGENKNNTYGDLIIWKQILNYATIEKKDIILITNDQKEDWWEFFRGQTIGPRIELKKEFMDSTSQRFHMYSLQNFIAQFNSDSDTKIDTGTIAEIESFSNIPPEEIHEESFRDYHYKRDGEQKKDRAKKLRYEMISLENKNQKRLKTIHQIREKYKGVKMPENVESIFKHTVSNLEIDNKRIERLQAELARMYYSY